MFAHNMSTRLNIEIVISEDLVYFRGNAGNRHKFPITSIITLAASFTRQFVSPCVFGTISEDETNTCKLRWL